MHSVCVLYSRLGKTAVNSDITVARQQSGQQLQANSASGYANTIIFSGSLKGNEGTITFAILNVTKSDRRTFKCDLFQLI